MCTCVNTLRPRQNGRHYLDNFWNGFSYNLWISIKISLNFVHEGPINNIPALVQIMAWRRLGDRYMILITKSQWSTHVELGPVWLDQIQIWILKSGSWNHGVVIKQNVKSESGFLKTNAKSESSFYLMSEFINCIHTNFTKMPLFCFLNFLLSSCGLWIA